MIVKNDWHVQSVPAIFDTLHTEKQGLSQNEAATRLALHGPNKLTEQPVDSFLMIFLKQFQSPLIYILLVASIIVFLLGEKTDTVMILIVLLLNAVIGALQEGKAQNTLLALKKTTDIKTTVRRQGTIFIISAKDLVPGDIILLTEGDLIPADARIIEANNLKIDEAALTGESKPIHKEVKCILTENTPTADQKNMLFKGTNVLYGSGIAVVVETGQNTVLGNIAKQIASIDSEVPLKKNIKDLSRFIIIATLSINSLLFLLGFLKGIRGADMLMIAVSLAVSIIPEGLPIVMTLVLATSVWRMSKRNVLVKKLHAVEALGQVRIIAVDKTGTLTKNELMITKVYADNNMFDVTGSGYEPEGNILLENKIINDIESSILKRAGVIATFCANAKLIYTHDKDNRWRVAGDPIEAAMLVFGQKMGINKDNLEKEKPIITDLFFDYTLRYHAVAYSEEKETKLLAVTGAPEAILTRCSQIWHNDETMSLSDSLKDELTKVFTTMSKQGLRVIACAEGAYTEQTTSLDKIQNLTFIAFFGMQDTLRSEVAQAMTQAKQAGIRVVMITGDHKLTAIAIAQEAGIYQEGNEIITGEELKILTAQQLAKKLPITSVFARVSPQDKLSIINGFKERGEIIAMTGDGVNDAPSLVAADLGVAMGNVGTEVAKEAADLVLLDDNFGNIVSAVEEGRSIHKTIKKVLLYLFAGGTCQVFTIFGGILLGYPLPLLAAQILWINFVTDGFLDIALAMEPTEANILHTTFEKLPRYIIDKLIIKRILLSAIPLALGTLYLFSLYVQHDLHKARTVTLTTLALGHLFCAWSFRSTHKSIFNWAQPVNNYLIMASLLIVSLQLTAIYTPFMQKILRTSALHYIDWLKILAIASLVIVFEEVRKIFNTPNA